MTEKWTRERREAECRARISQGGEAALEQLEVIKMGEQVRWLRMARGINTVAELARMCEQKTVDITWLELGLLSPGETDRLSLGRIREAIGDFDKVVGEFVTEENGEVKYSVNGEEFWEGYDSGRFDK